MIASDILSRVKDVLQDADGVYWTAAELLRWLSDARLDAYKLRPDLYEATTTMTLVDGAVQTLPDGSRWLFSVLRNTSSSRQRVVTIVDADALGRVRPNWRSQTRAAEIKHYLYDVRDPSHFEVYPPARAGTTIDVSYAKVPAVITADTTDLVEEGEFSTALVDYVLYRGFLKEADTVPAFFTRAAQHLTMFQATLSGTVQTKLATTPASQGK